MVLLAVVVVSLAVAAAGIARPPDGDGRMPAPAWEIPARMVVGTAIVLALTAAAGALGPGLSGVVAIFPVFAAILTVFTHRRDGPGQAVAVLRGLLTGLYGTAAFFAILVAALPPLGVGAGFALALAGSAAVQTATLLVRRRPRVQRERATSSITAR